MTQCLDCGKPSMGVRCRNCNGRFIQLETARRMAPTDRQLLAEVAGGLTSDRLAARTGVSRAAAWKRIRGARRRQASLASGTSGS